MTTRKLAPVPQARYSKMSSSGRSASARTASWWTSAYLQGTRGATADGASRVANAEPWLGSRPGFMRVEADPAPGLRLELAGVGGR
jgi:hypothetical protein